MKSVYTEKTCTLKINKMKSVYTEKKPCTLKINLSMKSVYTDLILVHTRFSKSVFTEVSADSKDFSKDSFTTHLYIREMAKGFKLSALRNLRTGICRLHMA